MDGNGNPNNGFVFASLCELLLRLLNLRSPWAEDSPFDIFVLDNGVGKSGFDGETPKGTDDGEVRMVDRTVVVDLLRDV